MFYDYDKHYFFKEGNFSKMKKKSSNKSKVKGSKAKSQVLPFSVQSQPDLNQFINHSSVIPTAGPHDYSPSAVYKAIHSHEKTPGQRQQTYEAASRMKKELDGVAGQYRDIIDSEFPDEDTEMSRVEMLYMMAFIGTTEAEKCADPQYLLPNRIYHQIKNYYRTFRPQETLPFATYLTSAQSALGCFGPWGAETSIRLVNHLLKKLKAARVTLVPTMAVMSNPEIKDVENEECQHVLDRITVRFIRQLALDLLYLNNETFKPDKELQDRILDIYVGIVDDPSLDISDVFPVVYASSKEPLIRSVTHVEYVFTVALGSCIAASAKDKVRSKLISAISQSVFKMPPGSLKRISKTVFEMIDKNEDPASLNRYLAAYFLLEALSEGIWLAATSPYAAYIRYLIDRVWFDIELSDIQEDGIPSDENEAQETDETTDTEHAGSGLTSTDTASSELAIYSSTTSDTGALESLSADFLMEMDASILFRDRSTTGMNSFIERACEVTGESDSVKLETYRKSTDLLISKIRSLNSRLDAYRHMMPDVETRSTARENKKVTSENEKIRNELESLSTELSELKDRYQKDCENNFSKGQKQTQSILYPELARLRKELEEERKRNTSLLSDQKELVQLRELIFNDKADSEESQRKEIEPLTAAEEDEIREFISKNKLVFVGGHIRQNRDFEQKYGHIFIADSPTFPPEAVANADLLIVFAHWVSHTTYYKATGIAKRRGTPVEYINTRNTQYSERKLLDIIRKHS